MDGKGKEREMEKRNGWMEKGKGYGEEESMGLSLLCPSPQNYRSATVRSRAPGEKAGC